MDIITSKTFFHKYLSESKVKYYILLILITLGILHQILKILFIFVYFFIKVYKRMFTIVPNLRLPN